jgi:hypothetical protein
LERSHVRQFGYEELHWIARHVRIYAAHDLEFVVDLYSAVFGYEESSTDEKTSISRSAILGFSSTRRQDYEMAWWSLGEAAPRLLDDHPVMATKAIGRAIAGYVVRRETNSADASLTMFETGATAGTRAALLTIGTPPS